MGFRSWVFAQFYDVQLAQLEKKGLGEIHAGLIADAEGDVLEIGAGTGRNLPHYGSAVTSITLTEPDRSMLKKLRSAVERDHRSATIVPAPAEDLPFDDDTFDTVVSALVLCGVADPARALDEMRRVLRPGGRLLLVEHVRAEDEKAARSQDRLNRIHRALVGCDCNRATLQTLQNGGFDVDGISRSEMPGAPPVERPLIVGAATLPR